MRCTITETAEHIIVHGFSLDHLQPYRLGEAFPKTLLADDRVRLFLVATGGETAGACVTLDDGAARGLYWVTTLPEFRSRGVGRGLMHALLRLDGRPVTLSASMAGKPLYDSLGFRVLAHSAWWSR